MSIADLTSARAVNAALDEYDRLGRDAFLSRYGFGKAREYFVRRTGRLYDSKAIAGAAFGYQHPDRGALSSHDFSGGEATVKAKLEELGFEIVLKREVVVGASDRAAAPDVEKAFHARMIDIYKAAKEIGYTATRFLGMVNDHGGLQTARILLRAPTVSDGYTALWERGRLDLTVEAVILEHAWHDLFTPEERDTALRRLQKYEYDGPLPPA